MAYQIILFNPTPTIKITREWLLATLTSLHYETLCGQYGLKADVVQAALDNLDVFVADHSCVQFIMVNYLSEMGQPLVVSRWQAQNLQGYLAEALAYVTSDEAKALLLTAKEIFTIELTRSHLKDAGLLLAYELARLLANQAGGLVCGLDEKWYCLNHYGAFLPIEQD